MVLSDHGDRSMTKLSDTQFVILSAAAQRDGGAVLPLPATLKIKSGAVDKVLSSLKATGLIDHQGTPRGNDPPPLRITRAGLEAIGVETKEACDVPTAATQAQAVTTQADTGATSADAAAQARDARTPVARAERAVTPAKTGTAAKRKARIAEAALAGKPAPRAGTKQSLMIELLKRAEGATVEQIAAATGWQHHTIRGAISGALKKRLGFTIEVTRARELGPNKVGAKGSSTVYRITGSSPSAK
jgi:DNA-binding MarR family transcriptional regulator